MSTPHSKYSVAHLPREVVLDNLPKLIEADRATLAMILAHIAEVDAQRYYIAAAYPSMIAYCMGALRMPKDSALKRIRVARAAREYPAILDAIAESRLTLTTVGMLKKYLTNETAVSLLAEADGKCKEEIEELVARLQQPELREPSPADVAKVAPEPPLLTSPTFGPTAPARAALHLSIDEETQDLLRYAQQLMSHQIPSGNPSEVFKRSLKAVIRELEKSKFAATETPRQPRKRSRSRTRSIPAHVRRAVRERDGFQCTFVSAMGHRCESRHQLQFDHVREYAVGGKATVDGIRLRCRVHNQFTAEQTFGSEFMRREREKSATTNVRVAKVVPEPPPTTVAKPC